MYDWANIYYQGSVFNRAPNDFVKLRVNHQRTESVHRGSGQGMSHEVRPYCQIKQITSVIQIWICVPLSYLLIVGSRSAKSSLKPETFISLPSCLPSETSYSAVFWSMHSASWCGASLTFLITILDLFRPSLTMLYSPPEPIGLMLTKTQVGYNGLLTQTLFL